MISPKVDGPDPDALDLAERLRATIGSFVRSVRGDADTPGSAQMDTLGLLDRDGSRSVAGLAALRGVKHQSMRLVVAQLEAEALVERSADPADGRGSLVTITAAGRDALGASREARATAIARLIQQRLSPAERDTLRQTISLLHRMSQPGSG